MKGHLDCQRVVEIKRNIYSSLNVHLPFNMFSYKHSEILDSGFNFKTRMLTVHIESCDKYNKVGSAVNIEDEQGHSSVRSCRAGPLLWRAEGLRCMIHLFYLLM